MNDDIFGLLALKAAGQIPGDEIILGITNHIISSQNQDGGWSFTAGGTSDSNTTAAAIVALVSAGITSSDNGLTKALEYLKTAQNNDGGFTYDPNSQWGTASDSSSTSWALWALNATGIDQATWVKDGNTPRQYLENAQDATGWFHYQTQDAENSFSPITTAYAAIALSGKTLPILGSASRDITSVPFRIQGSRETVCEGKAQGSTVLDVVKNASSQCGFTYNIKDTFFGPHLN